MKQIKNCNVLIVDDDKSVREMLESSLELSYSNVVSVENGESAVEFLKSHPIDLALLDINMDGMSGLELLQWIQDNELDVACVVISSSSELENVRQAVKLRAFDFVEKPFTLNSLAESCEHALSQRDSEREEAERELVEIFDSTENGMWVLDKDNTVIRVNKAFLRAFGYTEEQVIGKKCFDILENCHGSSSMCPVDKVWNGQTTGVAEIQFEPEDGKVSTYASKMTPYILKGEQVGVVGNFIDITQLKREEFEKEQYMERVDEQNTALRVLLREVDKEKIDIKKSIISNIDNEVRHHIRRIEELAADHSKELQEEIQRLKLSIDEICDDFYRDLGGLGNNLSPTELKVCKLFKEGCSRKEIASRLCVSEGTIKTHSTNIRKKLGINKSGVNLSTFLNENLKS